YLYFIQSIVCCPVDSVTYTLSLHDALPILAVASHAGRTLDAQPVADVAELDAAVRDETQVVAIDEAQFFDDHLVETVARLADTGDRKSTRLNSSHVKSSYAVFCVTKKTRIQ